MKKGNPKLCVPCANIHGANNVCVWAGIYEFALYSRQLLLFLFSVCVGGYVYGGRDTHLAMPGKAVELVLSNLHVGSGVQTQQHLYLQAISPA